MAGFQGKTVLVLGGAGFIGSNFIRHLLRARPAARIINFDKLTYSGNSENLGDIGEGDRYAFVEGDIADRAAIERLFAEHRPEYVINFAAETHVDRSIHAGSLEFIKTNIEGVFNLLEAVKKSGRIKKYVQVSTDEVFGALPLAGGKKFRESTAFAPNVPYAATKAGGDLLARAYHATWGLPVVVTHCSNNYGPYQYPEKLIPYFISRLAEQKKLPLYGDGRNVRDWIFVLDHCRALELCLLDGKPGEVYNIGADNELSNLEIAKMILKEYGRDDSWIEFIPDRPGHDRRYAVDASKIKRELGWKPVHSFASAFRETIGWYKENQGWVKRVREKTGVFNPHIDLWEAHRTKGNGGRRARP